MEEKIKKIADYYGFEAQSRQLIEEMAELIQASNKLWRAEKYNESPEHYMEYFEAVVEEIADVEIMLEQIKYLMNCEVCVTAVKENKVNRQMKRMEKAYDSKKVVGTNL